MFKRCITVLSIVVSLAACTPRELAGWVSWYEQDPVAAVEFANRPEIQAQLRSHDDPDRPQFYDYLVSPERPVEVWDRIAQCESGGRWDYPLVTNRTGTYSGGLMIWTKAWEAYGGHEFAQHAYLASKAQQIVVAERILADNGWGAWDCA
ncbi:MAG: transglycosylase family protein [Paenisporosarcina sp.]